MTDLNKRSTIKTLSAASAIAAVPAIASAGSYASTPLPGDSGLQLAFSRSKSSPAQTVTMTNSSSNSTTLKHVSPGLVKSGDEVFDVNDLLVDGPMTLEAGESRSYAISPLASGATERRAPGGTIANRAVTVSTHYTSLTGEGLVQTQRLCLA